MTAVDSLVGSFSKMLKIEGLSQSGDLVSAKEVKRKALPTSLTLWYIDVKGANEENWDQLQTPVVTVSTEEDLWNVHRLLIASNNQENTDFSLFREGISPDWNDTKNVKGGRWVIGYKVKSPTFMWRALITQLIQNEKINGLTSLECNGFNARADVCLNFGFRISKLSENETFICVKLGL